MKHFLAVFSLFLVTILANAQSSKQVKWAYTVKKVADKTFEIHMTAAVNPGWHLYAQEVGVEGPLPTKISFTKNPLVSFEPKVKEVGKMIKKNEDVWGGVVNYYEKSVEFVQVVTLKGNIKTNLTGKIEFMVCNDHECLPPADIDFTVNVGGK